MHTDSVTEGTDDHADLEKDLVAAAQAPARNFFKQPGDDDERNHPVLARVVKAVEGDRAWRRSPNQAFLRVLRQAIDALDGEMSGRPPLSELKAKGLSKEGPWHYTGKWKGCPAKRIALILYGELDGDPEIQPQLDHHDGNRPSLTYNDDYVPAAHRLANVADLKNRTKERPIKVIREDLTAILLNLEQRYKPSLEQSEELAVRSLLTREAPFISRAALAEQFNQLWRSVGDGSGWRRPNTICLVGEPGTGKSRFAQELPALTGAVWINAESPDALYSSLADALDAYRASTTLLDMAALKRAFAELLTEQGGPDLVVIDGIPDPEAIDGFLPHR